jgi:hypothetical protein
VRSVAEPIAPADVSLAALFLTRHVPVLWMSFTDSDLVPLMSPTVFREDGYRFYFFSREEPRMHIHVHCAAGEAKFWLEPHVEPAQNSGLNERQLRAVRSLIEEHEGEIRAAWVKHFGG